ncbi:MAG: hypothetical protein ACRDMJ_19965, partial [Solirubrobacteraceae bacterium]
AQARHDVLAVVREAGAATGATAEAEVLVARGEQELAGGCSTAARELFVAAAALAPIGATAWNNLAVLAHERGEPGALELVDSALFAAPDDIDVIVNRAIIQLHRGDRAGAVAGARRAAELHPGSPIVADLLALTGC